MVSELADFGRRIERALTSPGDALSDLFEPGRPIVLARAPGRLDVLGGIADYSGSLVLEWPIREACRVAAQRSSDRRVRIVSPGPGRDAVFDRPLSEFTSGGRPIDYDAARTRFCEEPAQAWAAYLAGGLLVLAKERGLALESGVRMLVSSSVPEGQGLASSAALEVAALAALSELFEVHLDPRDLALLAQQVENRVAGAVCGVMDQMTAVFGEQDRLLALLCQPAEVQGTVRVPKPIRFFGLDSGIRHAISGADYGDVRTGAFMGYRILAEHAGLEVERTGERVRIEDPLWRGYLANVDPSRFEREWIDLLPERIGGAEFLRRYGGLTDAVSRVDPDRSYAVRQPAAHPIREHARAQEFRDLLMEPVCAASLARLGELMAASHESYGACGLGSEGTDLLVDLVRRSPHGSGLHGAKITGGGSGGTVAVLALESSAGEVSGIAREYARLTGRRPAVVCGSSPGVACMRLGNTP